LWWAVAALVGDPGAVRDVWVGIRYQFLVGECDRPDADPQTTSDDYLEAAAGARAGRAGCIRCNGLCPGRYRGGYGCLAAPLLSW
jgi:hypothetical protein